ncbi:hypothetical protein [Glutamicibacter sp.]
MVNGTVLPGAYCKSTDKGKRGKSKAGKYYTCKTNGKGKLRWRA